MHSPPNLFHLDHPTQMYPQPPAPSREEVMREKTSQQLIFERMQRGSNTPLQHSPGSPSPPRQVYNPSETPRRQPPPVAPALSFNMSAPLTPFSTPFSAAPPSPALAWGPGRMQRIPREEKEGGVSRGMIGGGDTGKERKSVFWNRFSVGPLLFAFPQVQCLGMLTSVVS